MITQARLKELFTYDSLNGEFRWITKSSKACNYKIGDLAGTSHGEYNRIIVDGKAYLAHRLAWLYVYGVQPVDKLDHINGNGRDNSIANLRECSQAQNNQNRRMNTNNTSGYVGVSKYKDKWRAQISVNKHVKNLGYYDTPEEAHTIYLNAKANYHSFQPVLR